MIDDKKRVLVAGYGRMGSWLAGVISEREIVAVYDPFLKGMSPGDKIIKLDNHTDIKLFDPHILINAASPGKTTGVFEQLVGLISTSSVIADIASVKKDLPQFYRSVVNPFASFHPMFGPSLAKMNDLSGKNLIIIEESDKPTKEWIRELFSGSGLVIKELPFTEHDSEMIHSLTLPVVLSLLFSMEISGTDISGTSYKRQMDLASTILSEDPELLTHILCAHGSDKLMERIIDSAGGLMDLMKAGEKEKLRSLLMKAAANGFSGLR